MKETKNCMLQLWRIIQNLDNCTQREISWHIPYYSSSNLANWPDSFSFFTSVPPPMNFPLTNTRGTWNDKSNHFRAGILFCRIHSNIKKNKKHKKSHRCSSSQYSQCSLNVATIVSILQFDCRELLLQFVKLLLIVGWRNTKCKFVSWQFIVYFYFLFFKSKSKALTSLAIWQYGQ